MRRAWLLLPMLLAGCDLVYGLEGRLPPEKQPGDEDGDGRLDSSDPCPHIANESSTDADDDGLPVDCDPDDTDRSTMFRWFPITAGSLEDAFQQEGPGRIGADGFELGDNDENSTWLVLPTSAAVANIDIGFEILSNSVEDEQEQPWSELGVHTVQRGFEDNVRGAVCFVGIDQDIDNDPPTLGDAYIESKEDDQTRTRVTFVPPLNGSVGRLYQFRTRDRVRCGLARAVGSDGETELVTTSYDVTAQATTGHFAISADRVVARLTHVWVAWQP